VQFVPVRRRSRCLDLEGRRREELAEPERNRVDEGVRLDVASAVHQLLSRYHHHVQIDFTGTAGDASKGSQVYLTYELKNAVITGHSISSGGDKPSESISIAYEHITMTYKTPPATAKNKDGSPVVQNWSIIENKKG
jgi:RNA 3'-terminal phosphate cyclase